jgi:hypothetical protein
MLGLEELLGGPDSSLACVFDALPDAFPGIGAGGDIQQSLVGCGILDTAAALPFTVSTIGRLLFLICLMKSPERRRKVVRD